ncbi:hypothetical protein C7974DRAFT_372408 [Boeremia exigua]|uniref:uncharacterized protein n=1 Tax=Boeremia exigua TaxID=749465 RepID=UPI001E8D727C|nr:uncharacterized protein C7974DRAFT_372408 [Boeremia exigua]KAH6642481.1 hypothetical protein C7974DRAFT_372408 [Boeremia exigua]
MARPKTPTDAYQKEGKYRTGDSVWVLDGGRWWKGKVKKNDLSSGQNWKVEVTLDDGERRQTSVNKDDMRNDNAPDRTGEPSREPCDDPVEAKSMWQTIKAVTSHRAQHITAGKSPSVACVVAASGIQATLPSGLDSVLLTGVRSSAQSHQHVEPRIVPRPFPDGPARFPSTTATHSQLANSQQRSGSGSTAAGSDADSRVDETVSDVDDSEGERYLARSITGRLSEHEFQTSLPSPRWNAR